MHIYQQIRQRLVYLLIKIKISAHADGGPRSRVCARETLCSAPHRREWKFSAARVCRVTFVKFPNISGQNRVILEGRGSSKIFFDWNPNIYVT
jgi:hypothetical protein